MFALTFDTTINLGTIVGAVGVAALLFTTRRIYDALMGFVDRVSLTEDIVDEHTDVLIASGLHKGPRFPYISNRRHRLRRVVDQEGKE